MAVASGEKTGSETIHAYFETWMAQEQKRIYMLCLHLLRNRDEADSATQDVFIKAFRALQRSGGCEIREPAKWLNRVAVNTCLSCLRSRRWKFWKRHIREEDNPGLLYRIPAAAADQEETLIEREKMERLNRSLGKLSTRQRLVFLMRHDEGKSLNEIGEILGLEIGTVKAHMARAVSKLREELRDLYAR